jgi:hypothetical protein
MNKTQTLTISRSLTDIASEYAVVTIESSDTLVLTQCRLAYEYVGSAVGGEAAKLRQEFARMVSENLAAQRGLEPGSVAYKIAAKIPGDKPGAITVTEQAITFRVTAWKYMLRAEVIPTGPVAAAAYTLANAQVKDKEEQYVNPTIEALLEDDSIDPAEAFQTAATNIRNAAKKNAKARAKTVALDENITVDSVLAVLRLVPTAYNKANDDDKIKIKAALAAITL